VTSIRSGRPDLLPLLDIVRYARRGPGHRDRFDPTQIQQISRTVRRTPEVMVKVTGGGRSVGAVAAHFAYISGQGKIRIDVDDGRQLEKPEQKELIRSWHLELTTGLYRGRKDEPASARRVKLVHNIVLSMPRPTPAAKVQAAATAFARENFGSKHPYAMALHTHQEHPHVHLVVKAEGWDGQRLHIDKAMLRDWREQFAEQMRKQGVAANATPRLVRGHSKAGLKPRAYQAARHGRSASRAIRVRGIADDLRQQKPIRDPAHGRLEATRQAVVKSWHQVANILEDQGEIVLAGEVHYFANHLPKVMTDRERLADELVQHLNARRAAERGDDKLRVREQERTR
jgi:hypothetical protein